MQTFSLEMIVPLSQVNAFCFTHTQSQVEHFSKSGSTLSSKFSLSLQNLLFRSTHFPQPLKAFLQPVSSHGGGFAIGGQLSMLQIPVSNSLLVASWSLSLLLIPPPHDLEQEDQVDHSKFLRRRQCSFCPFVRPLFIQLAIFFSGSEDIQVCRVSSQEVVGTSSGRPRS